MKTGKIRKKKLIVIGVSLLCVAAVLVYYFCFNNSEDTSSVIYIESAVQKGDIVLGMEESGTVEMTETDLDYDLTIDTDDDDDDDDEDTRYLVIEDVYVSQGQTITEGDKLFKLTDRSVSSVRRILEANQSDAKITLEEATQEYETGKLEASDTKNETDTTASDAADLLQATTDELQASIDSYKGDIEALTAEISTLQEDVTDDDLLESLEDAKEEMESAKSVLDDTEVSNFAAYAANQSAYNTAKSAYDEIQDKIDSYNDQIDEDFDTIDSDQKQIDQLTAALKEKTTEAQNTHDSSVLNGQLSGNVYSYSVESLQEAVTTAQSDLDDAQTALDDFEAFVGDDGIIYADGSGVVTAVNYEEGDDLVSTGAMLTYTTDDAYTVSIDVSEEDISSITIGDSVDISFAAYEDTPYEGTVSAISTTTSDNHSTTVSYTVTIDILGDTTPLYGGMTSDVTFVTDSVSDVIYVSSQAIVEDGDNSYVYMKSGDEYTLVQVETGFTNGSETEITSGLSEGDTVYIQSTVSANEDELKNTDSSDTTDSSGEGASGDITGNTTGTNSGQNNQMPSGEMPSGGGMPGGN